jgi:serine/threonine protein kinase
MHTLPETTAQLERLLHRAGILAGFVFLDAGVYSSVYKARSLRLRIDVAVKIMHSETPGVLPCVALRELRAMTSICHANVIAVSGVYCLPKLVAFCLPLYHCSLAATIRSYGYMEEPMVRTIGRQVAAGLAAAHAAGFMHRDVKPANVLMKHGDVVVADWGLSRDLRDPAPGCQSTEVITLWYAPYEVACGQQYTHAADVWSFGMVLLEMLGGMSLFEEGAAAVAASPPISAHRQRYNFVTSLFEKLGTEQFTPPEGAWLDSIIPEGLPRLLDTPKTPHHLPTIAGFLHMSPSLRDLLARVLAVRPEDRLTMAQVCAHAFFADGGILERCAVTAANAGVSVIAAAPSSEDVTTLVAIAIPRVSVSLYIPGWNRSGTATDADLLLLTRMCLRDLTRDAFRALQLAAAMSWRLIAPNAATLLACVSLAYAVTGPQRSGKAQFQRCFRKGICGVTSPQQLLRLELVVLADLGGTYPDVGADARAAYDALPAGGIGQQLALHLWAASADVDLAAVPAMCSDYQMGVANARVDAALCRFGGGFTPF